MSTAGGSFISFLRTALTPFRMPDLKSSGMPDIHCTGMPKNQFSGRLIELKWMWIVLNPNLISTHPQVILTLKPPTPPHPRGALLQICLWLNLTFILDNYFCLSLETIFDDHPRISKGRVKKKVELSTWGGGAHWALMWHFVKMGLSFSDAALWPWVPH